VTGALIFGIIAQFLASEKMTLVARACAILALIFALITMLFGFMDWQHYYSGGWLHPIKMKLILAGVLIGLLILAAMLSQGVKLQHPAVLVIYVLSFLTVVGLGWFGDKLTYSARIDAIPKQFHPGALLFINNCYSCHPDGGNLIAPQLQLRSSEKLKGFSSFTDWVRHPKAPMPAFRSSRLSDQQMQILYQYLIDFVWTPQKPNAGSPEKTATQPNGSQSQESGQ
jgi:hypothetical protein